MRNFYAALLCLAIGLGICGCGGGGSGGGGYSNGFVGRYVGTYTYDQNQNGAIYLNLESNGAVIGEEINLTTNVSTLLAGTVTGSGLMSLVPANGGHVISGTLSYTQFNGLVGTLTDTAGNTTTVALNSTQNGIVFAGTLSGTFRNSNGDTGTFTVIISANGNVSGVIDDTTTNSAFSVSGSISNGGLVNLMSTYTGGTLSGTLIFQSNNQVTGTLTGQNGFTLLVQLTQS